MLSAEEMLDYCCMNEYGRCLSEEWSLKHFKVIEDVLSEEETVHMSFLSLGNIVHFAPEKTQKAYVITNKRLLIGQSKKISGNLKTINLDDIHEINTFNSIMKGMVIVDTIGGKITIDLPKEMTECISEEIKRILFDMQFKHEQIRINFNKPIKEKITQENQPVYNHTTLNEKPLTISPKKKNNAEVEPFKNNKQSGYQDRFDEGNQMLSDVDLNDTRGERKTDNMLSFGDEKKKHQTYKSLLDEGILTPDEYDEMINK